MQCVVNHFDNALWWFSVSDLTLCDANQVPVVADVFAETAAEIVLEVKECCSCPLSAICDQHDLQTTPLQSVNKQVSPWMATPEKKWLEVDGDSLKLLKDTQGKLRKADIVCPKPHWWLRVCQFFWALLKWNHFM